MSTSPIPLGQPRRPTTEEKMKLLLYLWKLEYGKIDGLTEEQRLEVQVMVDTAHIAVFDRFRSYEVGFDHKYSSIMVVLWSDRYQPDKPFYYDIFAWWQGKELHQVSPPGFVHRHEY